MFDYPYVATPDGDGWLITFPDIPEAITDADREDDIPQRAHDALFTALDLYVRTRRLLPAASKGRDVVRLGTIVSLKLAVHQLMVGSGVNQAALGRRMGTSAQLVNRLVDLEHQSTAKQLETAIEALQSRPVLTFFPRLPIAVRQVDHGAPFPERTQARTGDRLFTLPAKTRSSSGGGAPVRTGASRAPLKRMAAGSRKR